MLLSDIGLRHCLVSQLAVTMGRSADDSLKPNSGHMDFGDPPQKSMVSEGQARSVTMFFGVGGQAKINSMPLNT